MSDDTKRYTERDLRIAQRAAFFAGRRDARTGDVGDEITRQYARARYPLPRVTRPRVVRIGGSEFRVVDGALQLWVDGDWPPYLGRVRDWVRRPDGLRDLADLLAHPTEDVPEDEDE